MNVKVLYFLILVISISSCKKNESTFVNNDLDALDTINIDDQKDIRSIGETLLPDSKKKVENWSEYEQLDQLLTKFYSISPTEALNLSKELSTITQQLKDSVTIERFTYPDISIRINVLHNHALRLIDMSTISSINSLEVKNEIQSILDAFSALNAKINNITKQEKLEKELEIIEFN